MAYEDTIKDKVIIEIKSGESIKNISKKYGITTQTIGKWKNKIDNSSVKIKELTTKDNAINKHQELKIKALGFYNNQCYSNSHICKILDIENWLLEKWIQEEQAKGMLDINEEHEEETEKSIYIENINNFVDLITPKNNKVYKIYFYILGTAETFCELYNASNSLEAMSNAKKSLELFKNHASIVDIQYLEDISNQEIEHV